MTKQIEYAPLRELELRMLGRIEGLLRLNNFNEEADYILTLEPRGKYETDEESEEGQQL